MQNRILLVIGVVVLLLVSWNTWTVASLSARIDELEGKQPDMVAEVRKGKKSDVA